MIKHLPLLAMLPAVALADIGAEQLQAKLAEVPQFSASFSQQAFDFDNQLVQQSTGSVAMKAPLKFHWQQLDPDELLLVSDGDSVWYFDPFVEQVTISAIDDVLQQTPLPLLSSRDPELWAQWQVTAHGDCFELRSAVQAGIEMKVCFAGDAIETMQLIDGQGNRTLMTLTDFSSEISEVINFDFVTPDGTFIDDQRH
ncbi:outer membrane lipoprotein chaperone LolA [Ferrimonas lipolytica]|uniref:Outer-membrane lipoprotein carrier protein n=1 Tax=Ferrimonas lipolytica TaxID=2724191 RepID=A0A6H1UDE6_9GAMM|nr:outer membrane lipoprotein chaperone LolA [Ferrimonas lipolytica]QIZ76649.1 outer membrane lipoprotein chaperone LolA [Ferrimonas lipolytica]